MSLTGPKKYDVLAKNPSPEGAQKTHPTATFAFTSQAPPQHNQVVSQTHFRPDDSRSHSAVWMIHPQWLWLRRGAAAVLRAPAATGLTGLRSRAGSRAAFSSTSEGDGTWPLLKRRSRPEAGDETLSAGESLIDSLKSRQEPMKAELAIDDASRPLPGDLVTTPSKKSDSRVMLILEGLSPNLNASDFYRLAPNDLASWQSVIKKGMPTTAKLILLPSDTSLPFASISPATAQPYDLRTPRTVSYILCHRNSSHLLPRSAYSSAPPQPAQTRMRQRSMGELSPFVPQSARWHN